MNNDRFKFRIWNGTEMHYNDFVVTATGFIGKITEEFLGKCVFNQEDLTADNECVLMQCTGLKDKNGELIFENDIVKCDRDFRPDGRVDLIRQVVWKDGAFMLVANGDSYYLDSFHNIDIIGNIHENKGE